MIQLAGRARPDKAREDHRPDGRSSSSTTSRATCTARRSTPRGTRSRFPRCTPCSRRCRSLAKKPATPAAVLPLRPKKNLIAGPSSTKAGLSTSTRPKLAQGSSKIFGRARGHRRHHLRRADADASAAPGERRPGRRQLLPLQARPAKDDPRVTGKDLNSDGIAQDFDPSRAARSSGSPSTATATTCSRHHATPVPARRAYASSAAPTPDCQPALRDRARQRHQVVPVHRLQRLDALRRHRRRRRRSAGSGRALERGEEPRARPPDRRPARPVQAGRADERLRHARQGLAPTRRRRAAIVGLLLVALFLLVLYRFLGLVAVARARDLRRPSCTRRSCSST